MRGGVKGKDEERREGVGGGGALIDLGPSHGIRRT